MDKFVLGDIWMTNRGTYYKVILTENNQAILRKGSRGDGAIIRRAVGATKGWIFIQNKN